MQIRERKARALTWKDTCTILFFFSFFLGTLYRKISRATDNEEFRRNDLEYVQIYIENLHLVVLICEIEVKWEGRWTEKAVVIFAAADTAGQLSIVGQAVIKSGSHNEIC